MRVWKPSDACARTCVQVALLVKNAFLRRELGADKQEERFAKAVFELHAMIFYSYEEQWTHMHGLSIRPAAMQNTLDDYGYSSARVINGLLSELALFFLLHT